MLRDHFRWHWTLHVHVDPPDWMLWNINNRLDLRYMLTKGNLLDQQHRQRR